VFVIFLVSGKKLIHLLVLLGVVKLILDAIVAFSGWIKQNNTDIANMLHNVFGPKDSTKVKTTI